MKVRRLSACPECGAPIETSAKVYVTDVVLEADAAGDVRIVSSRDESVVLGVEVEHYYCANDHNLDGWIDERGGVWPQTVAIQGGEYST